MRIRPIIVRAYKGVKSNMKSADVYSRGEAVAVFEKYKQAAIYFEKVFPILDPSKAYFQVPDKAEAWPDIFGITIKDVRSFSKTLPSLEGCRALIPDGPHRNTMAYAYVHPQNERFRELLFSLTANKLEKQPNIIIPPNLYKQDIFGNAPPSSSNIICTLANIPIVDADTADFDQIKNLRKDVESKRKLRNLKLFLHETYEGKSKDFIEDDLHRRIYDFNSVIKKHGFQIRQAVLSTLFNSPTALPTIATAIASAYCGSPYLPAAAVAGAFWDFGKILVKVRQCKYDHSALLERHELAYIFKLKEITEK